MTTVDAGTSFGMWPDETSQLMYHDAMPALLSGMDTTGPTVDLGGANGLSRMWFPQVFTVDSDPTKEPDEVADLLTYVPNRVVDRVLLRYVLHYLTDTEVVQLMRHLARWHTGQVTLIQFVNDDVESKTANSVNETKHFRTEQHLRGLLDPWVPVRRVAVEYDVNPEFYRNRLGHPSPIGHREAVVALNLQKAVR